jgi:biotin carboxylase
LKLLLVLRTNYSYSYAHIATLLQMGFEVHIATAVKAAKTDPRFTGYIDISALDDQQTVELLVQYARQFDVAMAVTFYELDIVTASEINKRLGHPWARVEADLIARNKRSQRALAAEHGLPSVEYRVVPMSGELPTDLPDRESYIVKPTKLGGSIAVQRVDRVGIEDAVRNIKIMADKMRGLAYTGQETELALIEEYLPGREVTVDGVVVNGRFHLGAVTNKMKMDGPYFLEDFYTLPYRHPAEEPEIVELAQGIIDALGVRHCLFNAELRQDAQGVYRIVEFSTRMSGLQNYQNIRSVHTVDMVRLYLKALVTDGQGVFDGEPARHPGRVSACIKMAYRSGTIIRNNVGAVAESPYFYDYIMTGHPGDTLREPPDGWWETAGSLSVIAPYRDAADLLQVERIAQRLDDQLDILCIPGPGKGADQQRAEGSTALLADA